MKYHPSSALALTRELGPCRAGSLTGAVASQSVTEAPKGPLRVDGNHPKSALAARGLDCEGDVPSRAERRAK